MKNVILAAMILAFGHISAASGYAQFIYFGNDMWEWCYNDYGEWICCGPYDGIFGPNSER